MGEPIPTSARLFLSNAIATGQFAVSKDPPPVYELDGEPIDTFAVIVRLGDNWPETTFGDLPSELPVRDFCRAMAVLEALA